METHVITKEDLMEMLKRFDDKAKIVVQAGDQPLHIDSVDYSSGQININCHNDIEDEREDLEETISNLRGDIKKARSSISLLIHRLRMRDDRSANNVELTTQELNEIMDAIPA